MYVAVLGVSGLLLAALSWGFSLRLAPDGRGSSLQSLNVGCRTLLGAMLILIGAGGGLTAAVGLGERPSTVAFTLFASVTPVLAAIDAFSHRLPFVFSGGALVLGLVCFGVDALSSGVVQLQRAVLAFLLVGVLALAWWWGFGGQVGLGDVMLLAAIGFYTGWWSWAATWAGVTLGFLLAAVAALVGRWRAGHGGGYLPLGPWLLGGCWGTVALAATRVL